jgi:hypothetical protein
LSSYSCSSISSISQQYQKAAADDLIRKMDLLAAYSSFSSDDEEGSNGPHETRNTTAQDSLQPRKRAKLEQQQQGSVCVRSCVSAPATPTTLSHIARLPAGHKHRSHQQSSS